MHNLLRKIELKMQNFSKRKKHQWVSCMRRKRFVKMQTKTWSSWRGRTRISRRGSRSQIRKSQTRRSNKSGSNSRCRQQKQNLRNSSLKILGSTMKESSSALSATSINSKRLTSTSSNRMLSSCNRITRSSRRGSIETSMPCLIRLKRSTKNYRRRKS